ncbi:ATP-binding protein [Yeosuana sp. MJ-SS3]|uniref:histidine kinase n=1 Tax=Gilvirhabdus luticola TaxID=3079858 RepID=A0ABU3U4R2_9FLAO|nr:ATP-binding protein [Yeosuana sp. MJ-SS3]MDU8885312.1 ATP-binding protein [Yeosuana sp. MJ-SS3]
MANKIVFTFIITLFFWGDTFAQKEKDSLFNVWNNVKLSDSTRFEAISDLIQAHYLLKKTDSALVLGKQMLDLAQNNKNIKFEIEANTLIGAIYFELKDYSTGEKIYNKGLELARATKDSFLYAEKLFDLGYMYSKYEDYTNAFKTLQKSEKLYRELGDPLNEGWSIAHQGFIYRDLGDYKEAEKYHKKHLELSKKHKIKKSISAAYGNLGEIYHKLGDLPRSIEYWKKAIRLSKEINLEQYANVGTGKLVEIYIIEKQLSEATKYLNEYIAVTEKYPVPKYERDYLMKIQLWKCQIDYGFKNYTKALKECEECLKINNVNNWKLEPGLFKSLYEVNKKLNLPAIALDYFEKYQIAIDDEKKNKARTEIQSIVFNNQLVADSIAQAKEKELLNIAYEEGIHKKNREKNLILTIGLLVLLSAIAYFVISRKMAASERKRLNEINNLKNALFTNITHEFRTPLTVIKGMTDTIKSSLKNNQHDDIENSLEIIDRNSDGLMHLINEMLDLAKIESGNMDLNLVQVDIIPFTKYLTQSFHSLAEEKGINFSVRSYVEHLKMDIDANKFTAIITNLLSNAIKFTSENGEVNVHIKKIEVHQTDYIEIKVIDNGLGISKEEQLHIFDKFYQVDNSSSKLQKGTGIGLALVKDFVELMNGSINVDSNLGKSSVFRITIPITNNADLVNDSELVSNSIITKANVTTIVSENNQSINNSDENLPLVLIIEDNKDVAHYIKTCLIANFQILHAPNGAIGIEMALEKIPDIIISDVMMPEKDGYEVCKHLKTDELTDHIPIIMLTAKATFEDRLTGLSHGADAYLTKPFEKKELLTRIEQLILLRKKMLSKFEKTGIDSLLNKNVKNSETKFLEKIIKIIHDNIIQTDFGPLQLAQKSHFSESQLYRKLKATSGKSTAMFIRSIRLQKGKELIQTTDKTISGIAYEVGFNDPSYFSRAFKEEFGLAPSAISK